jgi:hypothetical protein
MHQFDFDAAESQRVVVRIGYGRRHDRVAGGTISGETACSIFLGDDLRAGRQELRVGARAIFVMIGDNDDSDRHIRDS